MITIYSAENALGASVLNNNCIAYQHEVSSLGTDLAIRERVRAGLSNSDIGIDKTCSNERDSDLHYIQSVLVTSNWNKNDDVFDPKEVWSARHTPEDKPTNVGHNEHEIVGHMTANWVIHENGDLIDDDTNVDDLPLIFHVVNGSVIYKIWQDEKLMARAKTLIEEIDAGKKFVSMECIFGNFDYAIISPDKHYKVIARNDETSFLTKHLRAYGGTGIYESYKVGRLLRNIIFTGKGFVDKPANPNSIIFDKEKMFNFQEAEYANSTNFSKNGVYINLERITKSEEISMTTDILKDQVSDLNTQVNKLTEQLIEANERLAKADVVQLEKNINNLETEVQTVKDSFNSATKTISELEQKLNDKEVKLTEMVKSHEGLQSELDKVKANELRTNRVAILVDGNIDKELAEKKVDLYSNLSDEQFKDIAEELVTITQLKNKAGSNEQEDVSVESSESIVSKETDIQDEEQDDGEADADVLDDVNISNEEVDLAVSTETSESDNFRVLSHALAQLLGQDDDDNYEEEK